MGGSTKRPSFLSLWCLFPMPGNISETHYDGSNSQNLLKQSLIHMEVSAGMKRPTLLALALIGGFGWAALIRLPAPSPRSDGEKGHAAPSREQGEGRSDFQARIIERP